MADATNKIQLLEAQITAATDTYKNVAGLVEKLAKIQAALMESGFDAFADEVSEPFSGLSTAAEKIQALLHKMAAECSALRT